MSENYRFSLLTRITLKVGEDTDLWSARDALVLKALALALGEHLPVSRSCKAPYPSRQFSGHAGNCALRSAAR